LNASSLLEKAAYCVVVAVVVAHYHCVSEFPKASSKRGAVTGADTAAFIQDSYKI